MVCVGESSLRSWLQSTPALWTPHYYGHPGIMDSSKIPSESYRRLTEINSRFYKLSLLRTYRHFIWSQSHNFIVFSLVMVDTEQHLGILAYISSLFFLLFETVFVFFGRFLLLLSISQNSFIFSLLRPHCSLAVMNEFVQSVQIFSSAVNLTNDWKFQSRVRSSIDQFSTDFCCCLVVSPF